eukprot:jgi/Astpho2/4478/Aster-x1249
MNAVLYADSDGLHHEISPELISSSSCLPQDELGKVCLMLVLRPQAEVFISIFPLFLKAGHHSTGKPGEVAPATLPDTPQNFPISESKLIDIAKKLYAEDTGTKNPDALAPAFRFEFPIVSLGKKEYLKAVGTFNLDEAFPNMASHPYHWRVDPYEPNRVWFTIRNTATHKCLSYTFDVEGRCTSFTGGYIMDRRVGNTKKMGAMFGILAAIGGPIPEPETIPYALFIISNRLSALFKVGAVAKRYMLASGEVECHHLTNLGSQVPIRGLTFSPGGSSIAISGDDSCIKLLAVDTKKAFKGLQTEPFVRSVAWDPEGQFLVAVTASGLLQIWDLNNGFKMVFTKKQAAPKIDYTGPSRNGAAWHPDGGTLLALPGKHKNVVLYERLSWKVACSLDDEHTEDINTLAFSPNGLYLASASRDRQVLIWDLGDKTVVARHTAEDNVSDLAWHPEANSLAYVTEDGKVAVWAGAVPQQLADPFGAVDAAMRLMSKSPGSKEVAGDNLGGSGPQGDDMHGFIDNDMEDDMVSGAQLGGAQLGAGAFAGRQPPLVQRQGPIQPGATPPGSSSGGRHFLAYTRVGCIVARQDDGFQSLEVSFHDVSQQRRRRSTFKDFFGFTLASLGPKGAAYASQSSKDAPSMLHYRPFESWVHDSEWQVELPVGEEAEALAAGERFVAVATSQRTLRILSETGVQSAVVTLSGAPVALVAQGHQLALAWHAADPDSAGCQRLQCAVYNVVEQQKITEGFLPTSNQATLAWLGFSDEGLLAAWDSEGVMRLHTDQFDGSWTPVFHAAQHRKSSEEFWPVGLSMRQLCCVVCKEVPQVHPRPVLSLLELQVPAAIPEGISAMLANEHVLNSLQLRHLQNQLSEQVDTSLERHFAAQEMAADRTLVKLFLEAVKVLKKGHAAKLQRALEYAGQMHTLPSLEGALRLSKHHSAVALSERLTDLIQLRLQAEAAAAAEPDDLMDTSPLPSIRQRHASLEVEDVQSEPHAAAEPAERQPAEMLLKTASHKTTSRPPLLDSEIVNKAAVGKPASEGKRKANGTAANPFARVKSAKVNKV